MVKLHTLQIHNSCRIYNAVQLCDRRLLSQTARLTIKAIRSSASKTNHQPQQLPCLNCKAQQSQARRPNAARRLQSSVQNSQEKGMGRRLWDCAARFSGPMTKHGTRVISPNMMPARGSTSLSMRMARQSGLTSAKKSLSCCRNQVCP